MIEIFLLWQLFGGAVVEVDSFVSAEACEEVYDHAKGLIEQAKLVRPEAMASYTVLPCVPVEVPTPEAEKVTL